MNKASDLSDMIKKTGLKLTGNRLTVLSYLQKKSKPVTAEEVSNFLKLNIVTVYRTLESFGLKGLIYQTDFRQGKSFFEFQDIDHHHHHITCSRCGFREHVDFCINNDMKNIKIDAFETVDGHMLEFFGLCKKCYKK